MNTNRDLSAEARSAKVDRLDEAIDRVVTRLVRVEENDELATQIVNALPERASWFGWLPRLAMTAGLAALAVTVVPKMFDERSTTVLRSAVLSSSAGQPAAVPEHRTDAGPTPNVRRTRVERPQNDRRTIGVPDFDRSLPAIAPVASLNLDSLAPDALPASKDLVLESLVIADLPLTAEFSPR
jgi:hypothetical protein